MSESVLRQVCIGSVCAVAPHPRNQYRPYLLRHPLLAFLSAFLLLTKVATVFLLSLTPEVASLSTITAPFLISQTNAARRDAGLPPLKEHALLSRSARLKAEDMLKHDYFEHTSPAGVTPWKWFDTAGYTYVYAGENLAIDFSTGEGVHNAWMDSPGHRRNILSDRYADIGIAVVTGEFQGRTTTVVVQHFGSLSGAPARAATPAPTVPTAPTRRAPGATEPLPSPRIIEPSDGQLLPSGASTVRGEAFRGSSVRVALDGRAVGSYPAPAGTFRGQFRPPQEEERDAVLTATAALGNRQSPVTSRRVHLDTRGPSISGDTALFLPDPLSRPGALLLVVPIEGSPARATASIGKTVLPLMIRGSVARAAVATSDSSRPIVVRAEDEHGNARVATVEPLRQFRVTPRTAGEARVREHVVRTKDRLRSWSSVLLAAVAVLLAINTLVYIRIQHADLIAHALFVLILGTMLFLIT